MRRILSLNLVFFTINIELEDHYKAFIDCLTDNEVIHRKDFIVVYYLYRFVVYK